MIRSLILAPKQKRLLHKRDRVVGDESEDPLQVAAASWGGGHMRRHSLCSCLLLCVRACVTSMSKSHAPMHPESDSTSVHLCMQWHSDVFDALTLHRHPYVAL